MYICSIRSNSSREHTHNVKTRSAYKAALEFGRGEGDEIVQILSPSGKVISEARWTPEDGGKYFRCAI